MVDPDDRVAGRLDDHVDIRVDQRTGVVQDRRGAGAQRLLEAGRVLTLRPLGQAQRLTRPLDVQIGDPDDVNARRRVHVGEKHRAETSGTDHADTDRGSVRLAVAKRVMQVHTGSPPGLNV